MAKMEGLAHVGLFVSNLERSKSFYCDTLNFKVIFEYCSQEEVDGTTTYISFIQNGNLIIELVQFENEIHQKFRKDGLFDHVALLVEDIAVVRDQLLAKGVIFESDDIVYKPHVFANGSKWLLFRGPDNEHLEIAEVL